MSEPSAFGPFVDFDYTSLDTSFGNVTLHPNSGKGDALIASLSTTVPNSDAIDIEAPCSRYRRLFDADFAVSGGADH